MQTQLPAALPSSEVDRELARKIREVYVRYGGRLTPFFTELSKQAAQQRAASKPQPNPRIREYLERRHQLAANLKSSEA